MSREIVHEELGSQAPVNAEVRKRVAALNLKNPRLPRTAEGCAGLAVLHVRECYKFRKQAQGESDQEQKELLLDLAREEEIQFRVLLGLRRRIRLVKTAS